MAQKLARLDQLYHVRISLSVADLAMLVTVLDTVAGEVQMQELAFPGRKRQELWPVVLGEGMGKPQTV